MSKELKPLLSALLGFGTIMVLQQTNVGTQLTQRTQQSESIMIFAALLIIQFLFEVLSKYEGKACEMTEGIFSGIMGVVGYSLVKMVTQRGTGGIGRLGGLDRTQFGGAVQNGILTAAGVAAGLWVWKRWLKPLVLPTECSPCARIECPPCPPPQVVVQQQQAPPAPEGVEQFYY